MSRIVISDDEYLEREVIKRIANKTGTTVVGESANGRVAVELCGVLDPDMIIINLGMGGVNGLEAIKKIREKNKKLVIVLTSAYNKDLGALEGVYINEFLLKPIKPSKIEEILLKYKTAERNENQRKKISGVFLNLPRNMISKEIRAALDYIDSNYRENISLEKISSKVFLSCYYFSRLFKAEVGVTFSSYVIYKKIEAAKEMLENTSKSALEISNYLNFNEQTYFSKIFKKYVGETPSKYRRMIKMQKEERALQ
jgi:YesN/AraC family two-component response regulator